MKPNASWVECMNPDCMAATQTYYDPDPDAAKRKAVAAWNRRTQPQNQAIIDFVNEVCAMAEQKMMITHKLEGAHYASMMELAKRYGYETNRNVKLVAAPSVSVLRGDNGNR